MNAAANIESPLLNVDEAAGLLRIARSTLYEMDANGKVPSPVRLATRVFWRHAELLAWIEAGCPARDAWEKSRKQA